MCFKKLLTIILFTIFLFSVVRIVRAQDPSPIYFFYGSGCPHCAQVEQYFAREGLYDRYPIVKKEIYFNRDNAVLYTQLMDQLDIADDARGVPALVIGDQVIIGDQPIINNFQRAADQYLGSGETSPSVSETPPTTPLPGLNLTLAAVVGASVVDAINPCAFAVLIILMTTILATGGGKKALKSGLAFSASIFISYFLMGLGIYHALGIGGLSGTFYKIVGWLAIILGLLNLKDWLWYGKGFLMEVPLSWRPRFKSLIHSVASPLGAFGIGFLVSLFLLPCTSGPYIVILGMLAQKTLQSKAILYLILYNLIFVSPMVIISLAVYRGFNPERAEKIRQQRLKTLHLIAGLIMLAMGIIIIAGLITS